MGVVQKDAIRTMFISYAGIGLGYLNKGLLFLIILQTDEIGLINLLLSVGILFSRLSGFGVTYTTLKFLPYFKNDKNNHNGYLLFSLLITLVGALIFTLLYLLFRQEIGELYVSRSAKFLDYYYWALPIGIGYVIFLTFEAYLRAFYKNIISVFANDIFLRLAVTFTLVLYGMEWINFDTFVAIHSIAYLFPMILLTFYLIKNKELNLKISTINISKRFRKILTQYAAFNYINSVGAVLVSSLDIIMIASLVGLKATGVYATVVFLTSAIQVPYLSILRISTPLVAEHWKHREMKEMQTLYTKVSSTGLLIGLSLFVFIWLNIDLAFSFLKPEFTSGIWVFFFLMIGKLLDMFFGINGTIFSTSKKFKYDILFTIGLIGIVYFLNLIFIPKWGIAGAAISTAMALITYNIGRIIFVWKMLKMHPFTINQFAIIALGIITMLLGTYVGDFFVNLWIRFIIVSFLFLLVFIAPILAFNLEPETKNFLRNGWKFIIKKK